MTVNFCFYNWLSFIGRDRLLRNPHWAWSSDFNRPESGRCQQSVIRELMLKPANSCEPCKNRPMLNCTLISEPTQFNVISKFQVSTDSWYSPAIITKWVRSWEMISLPTPRLTLWHAPLWRNCRIKMRGNISLRSWPKAKIVLKLDNFLQWKTIEVKILCSMNHLPAKYK